MKLGTVAYNNEIYNLDYMTSEEIKEIINKLELDKKKCISELKNIDLVKKSVEKE